jgi:hypothetical protein
MIQIAFDATAFGVMCGGIATVITSTAALVWAFRRDPRGGNNRPPSDGGNYRLPPAE